MTAELPEEIVKALDTIAVELAVRLQALLRRAAEVGFEKGIAARPPDEKVEYFATKLLRDPAVR